MIISFSTTDKKAKELNVENPLFAGIKTVTRRDWSDVTYFRMQLCYDKNIRLHEAWSNCPFVPGAKKIGDIHLTCKPYRESLIDMPEEDIYHEGNLWTSKDEFIKMLKLKPDKILTVVRFQFVSLELINRIMLEKNYIQS